MVLHPGFRVLLLQRREQRLLPHGSYALSGGRQGPSLYFSGHSGGRYVSLPGGRGGGRYRSFPLGQSVGRRRDPGPLRGPYS